MENIHFTSDLHFGHYNIIKYDERPFWSVEEMDAELIKNWNEKVQLNDTVYILGDISWYGKERTAEILDQLNGDKILIRGNHDAVCMKLQDRFAEIHDYKEIEVDGIPLVLCHYPIPLFNKHYYGAYMLYGHVHKSHEWTMTEQYKAELQRKGIPCNMVNVGTMHWDYAPVTLKEILSAERK